MEDIHQKLEIERVVNLLDVFQWVKISETTEDDKIQLTFEKRFSSGETPK